MIWAGIGILVGIIIGLNLSYAIPIEFIKYTAVLIVAILDSLFGAIKAEVIKEESYSPLIFLTGLLLNAIIAVAITLLGEKLGIELYLAVAIVFIIRIFSNLGVVRREVVKHFTK
ncbi:MAG: small basic family protein [Candidatus Peregrinibacteria bacterium]